MRSVLRQVANWAAIYAVALHTVLYGLTPVAAQSFDPLSVICHSGTPANADTQSSLPGSAPSSACEHCNLCSTTTPPLAPTIVVGHLAAPQSVAHVLRGRSDVIVRAESADPQRARGPPQTV